MSRAFTLIELILSISILLMLSAASFYYFGRANLSEALKKDREGVVTMLEQARSLTVASKEAAIFGVYFDSSEVVLFKGSTYNPADPENIRQQLNSNVVISNVALSDSSSQVIFSRLTGNASAAGTITLARLDDPTATAIVTVLDTGVIK